MCHPYRVGISCPAPSLLIVVCFAVLPIIAEDLPESRPTAILPAKIDLRPAFVRLGLPPCKQGSRNTCSVFTVAGAMEYAIGVQQGHSDALSVDYLNWASNEQLGRWDDGSFFSDIWTGFQQHGACTEETMPYDAKRFDAERRPTTEQRRLAQQTLQRGLRLHWIKEWDPKRGLNDEELRLVKQTLAHGWPVCCGFLWPKQPAWTDSVLDLPARFDVRDGHSVLLVGFRDDASLPGGGACLIRDSASGRVDCELSYDYLRAYMNDAVWIDYQDAPTTAPQVVTSVPAPTKKID